MPLPGSRVIPAGWQAHHRPVLATTRTATITFVRFSGPPVHDPATGSTSRPTTVVYSGEFRVQEHQVSAHETDAAAQQITTHAYQVSGAVEVDLRINDVGTVDASDDPSLVGRRLLVTDIQRGSLLFERTFTCTDDLEA
jgi:Family of unknown function (DUF6093)